MEDTVALSLPCDAIDSVLEEIDPGATLADSAFMISTPVVASLAQSMGRSLETPAVGRGLSTSKRGNSSKKLASSQQSPLTTRARARQKAGLGQISEQIVDDVVDLETDTEVDRGDVDAWCTLWGADMLVPYLRVRNFQTTSVMTDTLKRSFETHCYMENDAGFHICPFDELGNYGDVTEEDKSKWDDLWRMESDAFDEECKAVPEYAPLVGRKFYTWDGNHRVITWMDVSMSPERTTRKPWHLGVRCMIMIPPVRAYKQIEVAMHNLNASSHATVQYDWIQDAERCFQVLSSPFIDYNEMIGDDMYDEFEKSRQKSTANKAWYHANMTVMAAAYILSFAEITVARDTQHAIEEAEEKKLGKALTPKQKKDMWEMKIKEICGPWYNSVFKYATIVNPQLGPKFLTTVRELHNSLARQPKAERVVVYNVGVDRVKAFASTGIHKNLKIELLKAHYSNVDVKGRYHHPVNNDVETDICPWLAQWSLWSNLELISHDLAEKYFKKILSEVFIVEDLTGRLDELVANYSSYFSDSRKAPSCFSLWSAMGSAYSMYTEKDNLCRPLSTLSEWELKNSPWWLEHCCSDEDLAFVADAEEICWQRLQKEKEPYHVARGKIAEADAATQLEEAKSLEPSRKLNGLVLETSRTKKQNDVKQKDDETVTEGGTPLGKTAETNNPGSGRSSRLKSKVVRDDRQRKPRRKKDEEDDEVPANTEAVAETEEAEASPVAETAHAEGRQPKRQKKQKWHDGLFRTDIFLPQNRPVVAVQTSLKATFETIQSNKKKALKAPVILLEELKQMCTRTREQRKQGFVINKKNVSTAADCLYLDMPTGMKLSEDDDIVPSWNEYPEQDDLPRKLMVLAAQILDDRGCIIIQHPGTLRSTQQIADALDACAQLFKQVTSFFVHNETVQYEPIRNMKAS
ncbi:hypothetical protein R1sor_000640 [Riccia sorocarpa]|uniref:Uncharacterized protein n=1 Tax=Riccia sorocarpa TaxID=122646 RepID=A0ABD3GU00_9MARC